MMKRLPEPSLRCICWVSFGCLALAVLCRSAARGESEMTDSSSEQAVQSLKQPIGSASYLASDFAASIEQLEPFDTTGLEPRLANVLSNFYVRSFGGPDNWGRLQSLRFNGELRFPEGQLRFTAFKKKPDLYRVALIVSGGRQIIMGFNGRDAWKLDASLAESRLDSMEDAEARNFIRDATTGGHLLYPLIEGKEMELIGIASVDERRAFELKIVLPDGQLIRSFLDSESFAEVRQITINNVSGEEEIVDFRDFRIVEGLQVSFSSRLTVRGQKVYEIHMEQVRVNTGVLPFFFDRPPAVPHPLKTNSPVKNDTFGSTFGSDIKF